MSEKAIELVYEFGPFRLEVFKRSLLRGGVTVPLTPKLFETLLLLVENSGRVLTKDEMIRRLWPDTFVEESSLSQNVFHLRRALGDDRSEPQYIATIPKTGYHFRATVAVTALSADDAPNGLADGKSSSRISSLAVLPFQPLGAPRDVDLLGLGMADAIIIRLNELQQIQVSPTSAIFRYTAGDHDPIDIGRDLGVDAVLAGTAQQASEQVRVTVQLIRISDGRNLWSAKFDEHHTNIFAVQDSISEQVARSLALQITSVETRQLTHRYTDNAEAYQTYLMGLYFWNKRTGEGLDKAVEYFQQAIAQDPEYSLAYAGLADCYFLRFAYGYDKQPPETVYELVRLNAKRALELDPELAEAHAALAVVRVKFDRDVLGAETSFNRAIKANPNCVMAYLRYAWFLTAMGRLDEALRNAATAQRLDPLSPEGNAALGYLLYLARRYDDAMEYCERSLAIEPGFVTAAVYLGLIHVQKGCFDEAVRQFEHALRTSADRSEPLAQLGYVYTRLDRTDEALAVLDELSDDQTPPLPFNVAMICMALGKIDRAFELLSMPWENWTERLRVVRYDPRLDPIRSDPRFAELIASR